MPNHSEASKRQLLTAAKALGLDAAAVKNACRSQFGCSVSQLNDSQVAEFVASMPALAHTAALHEATGLGVRGPGGTTYKPDAEPAPAGQGCVICGRAGMWITGAGMVLCVRHQNSY